MLSSPSLRDPVRIQTFPHLYPRSSSIDSEFLFDSTSFLVFRVFSPCSVSKTRHSLGCVSLDCSFTTYYFCWCPTSTPFRQPLCPCTNLENDGPVDCSSPSTYIRFFPIDLDYDLYNSTTHASVLLTVDLLCGDTGRTCRGSIT